MRELGQKESLASGQLMGQPLSIGLWLYSHRMAGHARIDVVQ